MSEKKKKDLRELKWFFKLNTQFTLWIMLSILLSIILIFIMFNILGTIFDRNINELLTRVNTELLVIEKDFRDDVDIASMLLDEDMKIPEIDELNDLYPQYEFEYELVLDKTQSQVEISINNYKIVQESYLHYLIEAKNGVIIVGINIPELTTLTGIISLAILIVFVLIFLLIIGLFVGQKVKYLKLMTSKLESMAGGNLSAKIPIKGRNEITQVAWHINEMSEALKERIERVKEIDRAKTQLVANISHDLRTPLTSVMGYISLLQERKGELKNDQLAHYIDQANLRVHDASHLMDQLFDFVLISNKQIPFRFVKVNPQIFFKQLIDEMTEPIMAEQFELNEKLEACHSTISVDIQQMKRIADNLGQNIRKYGTKKKPIEINGHCTKTHYTITVGNYYDYEAQVGVDELLNQYFTTDRVSGKSTGLGLTICKEIVEQHGGRFSLEMLKKWFNIIIELPLCKEESDE